MVLYALSVASTGANLRAVISCNAVWVGHAPDDAVLVAAPPTP